MAVTAADLVITVKANNCQLAAQSADNIGGDGAVSATCHMACPALASHLSLLVGGVLQMLCRVTTLISASSNPASGTLNNS